MPNHRMNNGPSAMRGMLFNAVRNGEMIRLSQSLRSSTTADAMPKTIDALKAIAISISVVPRLGTRSPLAEQQPQRLRDAGRRRHEGGVGKAGGHCALPDRKDQRQKQRARQRTEASSGRLTGLPNRDPLPNW